MNQSPVVIYRPHLNASDERALIAEMVDALASNQTIEDIAAFSDAVWAREAQQRTWLGREAALPHARTPGVKQLALVIGTHFTGIEWGAPDQHARLFFLAAVPPNAGVDYLYLTQRITRTLRNEARRKSLLAAGNARALAEAWQQDP